MAAITKNTDRARTPDSELTLMGVKKVTRIYRGALLGLSPGDAAGSRVVVPYNGSLPFGGIAYEEADNSASDSTDGDPNTPPAVKSTTWNNAGYNNRVKVILAGEYDLVTSGATQAWLLGWVYASDSGLVISSGANERRVGIVTKVHSATSIRVKLQQSGLTIA